MSHKRNGQLTVTAEWAKHLRKYLRRQFWKKERKSGERMAQNGVSANSVNKTWNNNTRKEPPGETINKNLFSAEYIWKDNYNIIYIYKNTVLTNKFKVLSLDDVRSGNDQDNCYRIILVRQI